MIRSCLSAVLLSVWLASCTSVQYTGFESIEYSPRQKAVMVQDPIGQQVLELGTQMNLPHLTSRERCEKQIELYALLTRQLGSPDYVMIGSVGASGADGQSSGNTYVAMLERVAKEGGDVVLLIESGVKQWTTVHQTPGRATTTAYGAAVVADDVVVGAARSETEFTPSTRYTRSHSSAWGSGIVLRHVPGRGKFRQSLLELSDEALDSYLAFAASSVTPGIPSEELYANEARFMQGLRGVQAPGAAAPARTASETPAQRPRESFEAWSARQPSPAGGGEQ